MKKAMLLPLLLLIFCPLMTVAGPVLSRVQEVSPNFLTEMDGAFYFSAYDSMNGYALWKSDGTSSGTSAIRTFATGTAKAMPRGLYNANGTLYLCAYEEASGWELWKSDGTETGTSMVTEVNPGPDDGVSDVYCHLASINGTVFFGGIDPTAGATLWKTDGTAANTVIVYDLQPSNIWGIPEYLFVMNDTLYFVGNDAEHGDEWWKCEGPDYDTASTSMVTDIWTGIFGGVSVTYIPPVMNGYFYFRGASGMSNSELWRSNGTGAGTEMVKDINTGGSSSPSGFTVVNTTLFFSADDSTGRELWKSDGTDAGTVMVKDINPTGGSNPDSLAATNGILYFAAKDGTHGEEPWTSDGTESGTVMLSDINTGGDSSSRYFIGFDNMVFFRADDGINGAELWQTDGTAGNTSQVADIGPGSESSWPGNFLVFGNDLYFRATYDNAVPEGEGDALYRYGYPATGFYWPMFQPAIYGDKAVKKQ